MIVNHKYKFIYLKCRKVGSTSTEIALSKFCDENDIITPISDKCEATRKSLGYQTAGNCGRFYNHMPAREIVPLVSPQVWNTYFKFATIRDPAEALISSYYWRIAPVFSPPQIDDYILSYTNKIDLNWDIITIGNKLILDDFIVYDKMTEDANRISAKLGLPDNLGDMLLNIKTKNTYRPEHSGVRPETLEAVKQYAANTYKLLEMREKNVI